MKGKKQNKIKEPNQFAKKCQAILRREGLQFSKAAFQMLQPNQLQFMLKKYSQNMIDFGELSAQRHVEQTLVSIMKKMKANLHKQHTNIYKQQVYEQKQQMIESEIKVEIPKMESTVFVKKDREKEYDLKLWIDRRDSLIKFFSIEVQDNLRVSQEARKMIKRYFLQQETKIDRKMSKYLIQIQQLKESLFAIQQQFTKKERQCLPLNLIVEKMGNLKIIHIQYQQKINKDYQQEHRYSVSAFELFEVIVDNKHLSQVTLKGVLVQQFQAFIKLVNPQNHISSQRKRLSWLNLPKKLKLAIDAQLHFFVQKEEDSLSLIGDLEYFSGMLYWLSDIKVVINLGYWGDINMWKNNLQDVWKCLIKTLKKIKIQLRGKATFATLRCINSQSVSSVRQIIFGRLACFTEIAQLSFNQIKFRQLRIQDFLAIEQILRTIFENNTITHLQLYYCQNFPVFPQIGKIQSITNNNSSFRRQKYSLVRSIAESSQQLRSIKCLSAQEDQEELSKCEIISKQLQTLIIQSQQSWKFNLQHLVPHNIKYLSISLSSFDPSIETINKLSLFFPQLFSLISLRLTGISIGHQVLCTIPSAHLEQIQVIGNESITDQCLKKIDQKWPQLRFLTLQRCENIGNDFWRMNQFKGLLQLITDKPPKGRKRNQAFKYLKSRGIKAHYV